MKLKLRFFQQGFLKVCTSACTMLTDENILQQKPIEIHPCFNCNYQFVLSAVKYDRTEDVFTLAIEHNGWY